MVRASHDRLVFDVVDAARRGAFADRWKHRLRTIESNYAPQTCQKESKKKETAKWYSFFLVACLETDDE